MQLDSTYFFQIYLFTLFIYFISGRIIAGLIGVSVLENASILNKIANLTASLFLGFVFITSVYAVYKTCGKTIFICPIFILIVLIIKNASKWKLKPPRIIKSDIKLFFFIFWALVIVFCYHFFVINNSNNLPAFDVIFYGKIADNLSHGIESSNIYAQLLNDNGISIYHYGDLYPAAMLSDIFQLSESQLMIYCFYPVIHFCILISAIALVGRFFDEKPILIIVGSVFLLYGIGFYGINIDNEFFRWLIVFRGIPFSYFKIYVIYFILFVFVLLYQHNKLISFFILSFLPIFYSTTIPAFIGMICVTFLYAIINKKQNYYQYAFILCIPLCSIFILKSLLLYSVHEPFVIAIYTPKQYLVFFIEALTKVFIEHYLVVLLLLYCLYKFRIKILNNYLIIFVLASLFSAFIYVVLHRTDTQNINQILNNISPCLIFILAFVLIDLIPKKLRYLFLVITSIHMFFNFYRSIPYLQRLYSHRFYNQSEQFIHQTMEITSENPNYYSCSLSKKLHCNNWIYDYENPYNYIGYNKNTKVPLDINDLVYPKNLCQTNNIDFENSPLSNLFCDGKISASIIFKYLKSHRIKYLFSNRNDIPKWLLNHCKLIIRNQDDTMYSILYDKK